MRHWTDRTIRVHLFTRVLALQLAHLMRRTALQAGMRCSVREMLPQLAGIGESVLIYLSTGGRPEARRMLTETTPEQDRLVTVFGLGCLDQSAATRGWGLWLGVRTHRW